MYTPRHAGAGKANMGAPVQNHRPWLKRMELLFPGYSSHMAGFVRDALLSIFLLCTTLPLGAQAPGFPSNEQLRRFKTMSDPRLAPDGKRILIRITEATADGAKSHLWLTGAGG